MASLEPVKSNAICWTHSGALHANADLSCHGALMKLTPEMYEKIWISEGGRSPKSVYEEVVVTVYPYDEDKEPVQAVALRTREHLRLDQDLCPSSRYMSILCQGAAELGLQQYYQEWLKTHPVQRVPWILRKVALYNAVLYITMLRVLKMPSLLRFQSWLVWQVYVPSTRPLVQRILSNISMGVILFPGSIMGCVVRAYMYVAGVQLHPMLKAMEDSAKDSSRRTRT